MEHRRIAFSIWYSQWRLVYCYSNKLTSLQYCPTTVGRDFSCSNNPFKVTKENEAQWIKAIKNHKDVYEQIKDKATPQMTKVYKLMWEV